MQSASSGAFNTSTTGKLESLYDRLIQVDKSQRPLTRGESKQLWISLAVVVLCFTSTIFLIWLQRRLGLSGFPEVILIGVNELFLLITIIGWFLVLPIMSLRAIGFDWRQIQSDIRLGSFARKVKFNVSGDEKDLELITELRVSYSPEVLNFASERLQGKVDRIRTTWSTIVGTQSIGFIVFAAFQIFTVPSPLQTAAIKNLPIFAVVSFILGLWKWVAIRDEDVCQRIQALIQVLSLAANPRHEGE